MGRPVGLLVLGPAVLILAGCGSNHSQQADHQPRPGTPIAVTKKFTGSYPIKVVGTTGMVADLVRNVGGRHVQVEQLMGPDVDPHTYKASTGDVGKLGQADLIFYSGFHLEGKMGEIFLRLARKQPTFAVAEHLEAKHILLTPEQAYDPHLWFDVSLWSLAAGVVRDVLTAYDPPHQADYDKNGRAYQDQLAQLHTYAQEQLATIPPSRRVLVTAHDAFAYFGRAYGLEVRGIQGWSTATEASVKDINNLVNFLSQRAIKAVFVESSVNPRNVEALIEGCQARGHKIVLGGTLYSDALGSADSSTGTYLGMVRHNVDTIVKALK